MSGNNWFTSKQSPSGQYPVKLKDHPDGTPLANLHGSSAASFLILATLAQYIVAYNCDLCLHVCQSVQSITLHSKVKPAKDQQLVIVIKIIIITLSSVLGNITTAHPEGTLR